MDIARIEEGAGANSIKGAKFKSSARPCLFYKGEACSAPHSRFEACRTCVRINEQAAVKSLFDRIKDLAVKMLNLKAKELEQSPLQSSCHG